MVNDRCPWGVSLAKMPRIIVMPSMRLLFKKKKSLLMGKLNFLAQSREMLGQFPCLKLLVERARRRNKTNHGPLSKLFDFILVNK